MRSSPCTRHRSSRFVRPDRYISAIARRAKALGRAHGCVSERRRHPSHDRRLAGHRARQDKRRRDGALERPRQRWSAPSRLHDQLPDAQQRPRRVADPLVHLPRQMSAHPIADTRLSRGCVFAGVSTEANVVARIASPSALSPRGVDAGGRYAREVHERLARFLRCSALKAISNALAADRDAAAANRLSGSDGFEPARPDVRRRRSRTGRGTL